jgi:hypothetical protein
VVTHLTTNEPLHLLSTAEQTGSAIVSCQMVIKSVKFPVSVNQEPVHGASDTEHGLCYTDFRSITAISIGMR